MESLEFSNECGRPSPNFIEQKISSILANNDPTGDEKLDSLEDSMQSTADEFVEIKKELDSLLSSTKMIPIDEVDVPGTVKVNMFDGRITVDPPIDKIIIVDAFTRTVKKSIFISEGETVNLTIFDSPLELDDEIAVYKPKKEEQLVKIAAVPPDGDYVRPSLRVGHKVLACVDPQNIHDMPWKIAEIKKVYNRSSYDIAFIDDPYIPELYVNSKNIAFGEPPSVRIGQGIRVVALQSHSSTKKTYLPGFVAEPPKPANKGRYLIFFENQSVSYVTPDQIFVVADTVCSIEEAPSELRNFLKDYLKKYPERLMVKFHKKSKIRVLVDNKWVKGRVSKLDCSLVELYFKELNRYEWLYRGSPRLEMLSDEFMHKKRIVKKSRPVMRITNQQNILYRNKFLRPFVQYTNDEDQEDSEIFVPGNQENLMDLNYARSDQYQTKICESINIVEKITRKFLTKTYHSHTCNPLCVKNSDPSRSEIRDINPFSVPVIWGWTRELSAYRNHRSKVQKCILYRAPCGKRLRSLDEVDRYLALTDSTLSIDFFTFDTEVRPFSELKKPENRSSFIYLVPDIAKGSENHSISCINQFNSEEIPYDFEYCSRRFPGKGVHLESDPRFLLCCSCEDDCRNARTCECQVRTKETTEWHCQEREDPEWTAYEFRRLKANVMTGIWECNANCPCSPRRCNNRVVQNGMMIRLQIFFTGKKGWGIRTLHDIPRGAFLCTYAAELLNFTETISSDVGRSDEYFADLDYIEAVENHIQQKEGFEEAHSEVLSSDDSSESCQSDKEDEIYLMNSYQKEAKICKLHKRTKNESLLNKEKVSRKDKFQSVRSFYNEDEAYTLDAKKKGNIGRFLNHSCDPNCFVQNVFVDSHDLRFPCVAFFALHPIRAFTELTWDYGYVVDSVEGRKITCFCGSANCRGRLL